MSESELYVICLSSATLALFILTKYFSSSHSTTVQVHRGHPATPGPRDLPFYARIETDGRQVRVYNLSVTALVNTRLAGVGFAVGARASAVFEATRDRAWHAFAFFAVQSDHHTHPVDIEAGVLDLSDSASISAPVVAGFLDNLNIHLHSFVPAFEIFSFTLSTIPIPETIQRTVETGLTYALELLARFLDSMTSLAEAVNFMTNVSGLV